MARYRCTRCGRKDVAYYLLVRRPDGTYENVLVCPPCFQQNLDHHAERLEEQGVRGVTAQIQTTLDLFAGGVP